MDNVTVIIRVIRSFEYRNIRNIVLRSVPVSLTTEDLMARIFQELQVAPGLPPPFRKYDYDTLKIEHQAHGAKSNDPVINIENDDILILKAGATLKDSGIKNETEISFFKYIDYAEYRKSPCLKIG